MKRILKRRFPIKKLIFTLALICIPSLVSATLVTFTDDCVVHAVHDRHGFLQGILAPGSILHVEAFYDTDFARPGRDPNQYRFPSSYAGFSFSIGDYVWKSTGRLEVHVHPLQATSYQDPRLMFRGYTATHVAYWTTISTPFDGQDDYGKRQLFYWPSFRYLPEGLPTSTEDLLMTRRYSGGVFESWKPCTEETQYHFQFTNVSGVSPLHPVPVPATILLLGSGLLGVAGVVRRLRK